MNSQHAPWEASAASHTLTFFNNLNNIIGIEAEFIRVLSIIGIQSLTLWHLRLGLRLWLRSAPCWGRPAGRLPSDSVERKTRETGTPGGLLKLLRPRSHCLVFVVVRYGFKTASILELSVQLRNTEVSADEELTDTWV